MPLSFASFRRSWLRLLPFALALSCGRPAPVTASSSLPPKVTLDLGHGVEMEFVLISPGAFVMGSDPNVGDGDETPQHKVTLTHPFYMGRNEVTQRQWSEIMGGNPSHFRGAAHPVDTVSWNDCQRFIAALSAKTGRAIALPTEAQWEYACRAGTTTRWYFGDDESVLGAHGWFGGNAHGATHPVGAKPPNPWGLYDMSGNVWEWCADWYGNPYPPTPAVDPTGPATGSARVLRGGAWGDDANQARSAYRNSMGPDQRNPGSGFRCVLDVGPPPAPRGKLE